MAIKDFEKIKKEIIDKFKELLKQKQVISSINTEDAYGHSAGTPMEEFVKHKLIEAGWEVYYPNRFLNKIFNKIGKDRTKIEKYTEDKWWGTLLFSKKQIIDFLADKKVNRWQQEGADLVLVRDDFFDNAEDIILINVKSHNLDRDSRAPNIMSVQRLLEFFKRILNKDNYEELLTKINLLFIGVDYKIKDGNCILKNVHVKDLYKLDSSQIPQINFDAAIQLQWHVCDMVEKEQTKKEFILTLAKCFKEQWDKHSEKKSKKYTKLVKEIKFILET